MNDVATLNEAEQLLAEVERRPRRFSGYSSYRASGARWLGDIPEHWQLRRLKFIADIQNSNVDKKTHDGETPVKLCNYVDVYYRDHITGDVDFMSATATSDEIRRFQLRPGDVLITKDSEAWDDIAVPAVVSEELEGVLCGYHLAQIRPKADRAIGDYIFRAFEAHPVRDQFRVRANGITRFGLSRDAVASATFPVPPLDEQRAIAGFLDRETAKIDGLVAKKRRLIELLAENRTALISHAVTKGLNPDAPMKPSGIEWLGEVPAHWEVLPIKRCCWIRGGQVDPRESEYACLTLIAPDHIESQTGRLMLRESAAEQAAISGKYMFQPGDVLYSKIRPELAKAVIGNEVGLCSADMYAMVPNHRCIGRYLLRLILSDVVTKMTVDESLRVAMPKVNRLTLGRIPVPLPPTDEQAVIADYIETMTTQIDGLCDRIRGAIDTVNEYRSSLISAAVTGQIDVRGEVGQDDFRHG